MGSMGAGVKQRMNMRAATTARISRERSSGTCSSKVRGWCLPNMTSMATISPVHTSQLDEK
jgi:hypothetical protein